MGATWARHGETWRDKSERLRATAGGAHAPTAPSKSENPGEVRRTWPQEGSENRAGSGGPFPIGAVMGGHKPGDKIAENELPERSPASKTPHNPSLELSRGPSALIFDDGSRRGHPEAPGGPKRRKRRFEHFLFVAWFVSPHYRPYCGPRVIANACCGSDGAPPRGPPACQPPRLLRGRIRPPTRRRLWASRLEPDAPEASACSARA